VIKDLFDGLRMFNLGQSYEKLESLINACVFFAGSNLTRKPAVRLLFFIVFNPTLLRTKISKLPKGTKQLQILVPDFCEATFLMMAPFSVQAVRQPLRDDLLLTDEQKDYIRAMSCYLDRQADDFRVLAQVSDNFVSVKSDDYQSQMQSFEAF
jgi:hypothetical protein